MVLTQLIHLFLLPPGLQCLLALCALVLAWRGRRYSASLLAVLALASLYVLATPVGSDWLSRPLEARVQPLKDLTQLQAAGYGAIVALGGGRTPRAPEFDGLDVSSPQMLARLRYAARIQRASGLPILVTGGMPLSGQRPEAELMAESLREDFGVPVRWLEPVSKTTAENAELTAAILLPLGIRQIVLVSHASHLPRAVKDFERVGFTVLPAPTQFTTEAAGYSFIERWTPQHESLSNSRRALHEWLGLARDSLR
ncbi:MAG: YdcF family protein [Pseudomonadota bacterium]